MNFESDYFFSIVVRIININKSLFEDQEIKWIIK